MRSDSRLDLQSATGPHSLSLHCLTRKGFRVSVGLDFRSEFRSAPERPVDDAHERLPEVRIDSAVEEKIEREVDGLETYKSSLA